MSAARFGVEASAGPAREGLVGGGARLLVRVRVFDEGEVSDAFGRPCTEPDVLCDLRTDDARRLAFELLACAEHAERITREAEW